MTTFVSNNGIPEVVMPTCTVQPVLKGQKALVTGANSGIGLGVALALGRAGADVVVNYVSNDEAAQRVVEEIRDGGVQAYAPGLSTCVETLLRPISMRSYNETASKHRGRE